MLSEFGKKARAYRFRNGWLLYDMAVVMRISTAKLSAYETGRKTAPDDVVKALEILIECEKKRGMTDDEIKKARECGEEIKKLIAKIRGAV